MMPNNLIGRACGWNRYRDYCMEIIWAEILLKIIQFPCMGISSLRSFTLNSTSILSSIWLGLNPLELGIQGSFHSLIQSPEPPLHLMPFCKRSLPQIMFFHIQELLDEQVALRKKVCEKYLLFMILTSKDSFFG